MAKAYVTNLDVNRIMNKLGTTAWLTMRKMSYDAYTAAVATTPVDTGRARGSWSINEGSGKNADIGPQAKSGSVDAAKAKANAQAMGNARAIFGKTMRIDRIPVLVVSNYVDYINYLNDGTTKMKGHHMAEHAIAAAKGKAKFI